jgi:hypothetical protein
MRLDGVGSGARRGAAGRWGAARRRGLRRGVDEDLCGVEAAATRLRGGRHQRFIGHVMSITGAVRAVCTRAHDAARTKPTPSGPFGSCSSDSGLQIACTTGSGRAGRGLAVEALDGGAPNADAGVGQPVVDAAERHARHADQGRFLQFRGVCKHPEMM